MSWPQKVLTAKRPDCKIFDRQITNHQISDRQILDRQIGRPQNIWPVRVTQQWVWPLSWYRRLS